jgi:hypothetical protein
MRTASCEDHAVQWVVRLEGGSFDLVIGEDRGDDWFDVQLHGSGRSWHIPTVLHEMGLWGKLRERVDHRKLADVLEQNIAAVLRYLSQRESYETAGNLICLPANSPASGRMTMIRAQE